MAKPNLELIQHIRNAAIKLQGSATYQWGHMGSCNCGFLAREISNLTKGEIHQRAMQKYGDWNEQIDDYCPESRLPMDELISQMLNAGLDRRDLKHLEKLSDPDVLKKLPVKHRHLIHNRRDDVVLYLKTWAEVLEEELLQGMSIGDISGRINKKNLATNFYLNFLFVLTGEMPHFILENTYNSASSIF
jgi:hypothetical protein